MACGFFKGTGFLAIGLTLTLAEAVAKETSPQKIERSDTLFVGPKKCSEIDRSLPIKVKESPAWTEEDRKRLDGAVEFSGSSPAFTIPKGKNQSRTQFALNEYAVSISYSSEPSNEEAKRQIEMRRDLSDVTFGKSIKSLCL